MNPADFAPPPWDRPLDREACLAPVPEHARVKGMFMQTTLDACARAGQPLQGYGPYRAFKDYPLVESMNLGFDAVPVLFPGKPTRIGLRELGWSAYPTMANTLIGRVIFGLTGNSPASIYRLAAKAYNVSVKVGRAKVLELDHEHAIVRLSEMYNFPDTYQVGVFEGVLQLLEREGEVLVRRPGEFEIDILARWRNG